MSEIINEQDPSFLSALRSGDREACAKLVDLHSNQIYRLALKMLNDPADAEDVLQETFIKAFRSITSFEGRSSLSTWLYRIAVNEALMLIRKQKPQVQLTDEKDDENENSETPVQIVDWCCLPERELMSTESKHHLNQAISELPETLRIVFILRDIEGLSIRETAETIGITGTNVKTRLLRARLRLRESLSQYYGERYLEK